MIETNNASLREKITILSEELNNLIDNGHDILSPKILDISTKLDKYITKYYKLHSDYLKNNSENNFF